MVFYDSFVRSIHGKVLIELACTGIFPARFLMIIEAYVGFLVGVFRYSSSSLSS